MGRTMDELTNRKIVLLEKQKKKSMEFHECLASLNEVSRKTCKNLEAAVAASKNPGTILYYEQPHEAKAMVKDNRLQKLQNTMMGLQKEIDHVDDEMQEKKKMEIIPEVHGLENVTNLRQWLATYGSPKPAANGFLTSFHAGSKVYGGTNHYSAFKTSAKSMKQGRLTK